MNMFHFEETKTVTILRPTGLSPSFFLAEEIADATRDFSEGTEILTPEEISARCDREQLDEQIATIRELVEYVASDLHLQTDIHEYDLPTKGVPSRSASKWIKHSDMLVTIDSQDAQIAYVSCCLKINPVMSALLAYRDADYPFEGKTLEILDAHSLPLITSAHTASQKRIFATHISQTNEEKMIPIIAKALKYPH